jgi:hypothetical protein
MILALPIALCFSMDPKHWRELMFDFIGKVPPVHEAPTKDRNLVWVTYVWIAKNLRSALKELMMRLFNLRHAHTCGMWSLLTSVAGLLHGCCLRHWLVGEMEVTFDDTGLLLPSCNEVHIFCLFYFFSLKISNRTVCVYTCNWTMLVVGAQLMPIMVVGCSCLRFGWGNTS